MSRRAIEGFKTALIALLLASAVLLGYISDVFGGVSGAFSPSQASSPENGAVGAAPAEAARPAALVLTNATGERAVFKYDADVLDQYYERTSSSLGEALGALTKPEECQETDWRQALKSPGIMFEYHESVPLELARDWMGASGEGFGITLRRICLVFVDDAAALYFEDDGKYFMSQTSSIGGDFSVSASYDGSVKYLFELDDTSAAPYMILIPDSVHATALSQNPLTDSAALASAVSVLGIDIRLATNYNESDGTSVYISSAFSLFVSPDGVVTYRRDNESGTSLGFCQSVDIARRVAASSIGMYSGDARVYFSGFSYDNSDLTILFDYYFEGGRVFFPGYGNAARITVSGGAVTSMTLCFRSFTAGDEALLLPEKQALAISNGEFSLGYADSPSATPFWYSYEPGATRGAA